MLVIKNLRENKVKQLKKRQKANTIFETYRNSSCVKVSNYIRPLTKSMFAFILQGITKVLNTENG